MLLAPVVLVGLLALVLARAVGEAAGDWTGAWIMRREGMAERMARRPVAGRVAVGLIALGLIPYLVLLTALVSSQPIQGDASTIARWLTGGAASIGIGVLIFAIWWRRAAPSADRP